MGIDPMTEVNRGIKRSDPHHRGPEASTQRTTAHMKAEDWKALYEHIGTFLPEAALDGHDFHILSAARLLAHKRYLQEREREWKQTNPAPLATQT